MPVSGLSNSLEALLNTLLENQSMQGWSIYEEHNGSVTVKLRFCAMAAGHTGVQSTVTYNKKSDKLAMRDRDRALAYTERQKWNTKSNHTSCDGTIEQPRGLDISSNISTGNTSMSPSIDHVDSPASLHAPHIDTDSHSDPDQSIDNSHMTGLHTSIPMTVNNPATLEAPSQLATEDASSTVPLTLKDASKVQLAADNYSFEADVHIPPDNNQNIEPTKKTGLKCSICSEKLESATRVVKCTHSLHKQDFYICIKCTITRPHEHDKHTKWTNL